MGIESLLGGISTGNPAGIALSEIPQVYKLIQGIQQARKAKKLLATPRPTYNIPNSITEATNNARANSYDTRLPNQDYLTGKISGSTAQTIRAATQMGHSPGEILATVAAANGNENEALNNMMTQSLAQKQQKEQGLQTALNNEVPYEDQAWSWNKQAPYVDAIAKGRSMQDAGRENTYKGLQGIITNGLNTRIPGKLQGSGGVDMTAGLQDGNGSILQNTPGNGGIGALGQQAMNSSNSFFGNKDMASYTFPAGPSAANDDNVSKAIQMYGQPAPQKDPFSIDYNTDANKRYKSLFF